MKRIGIIGGGFSGTMTAVGLIHQATTEPCQLVIINERESFNRGVAFNPYSRKHLLNVITESMSAFPDKPHHFLNWVMDQEEFANHDKMLLAHSFLPRYLYGNYVQDIWENAVREALTKDIEIAVLDGVVTELDIDDYNVAVTVDRHNRIVVDQCVIATGNQLPRNPTIVNASFYSHRNYFQNPWLRESVQNIEEDKPVLLIGNGLTMVDTVVGLLEQGFHGEIHAISPNGFNILPHRHNGLKYTKFTEDLPENVSLLDIVRLANHHIKLVRKFGISAEPVIDSIRPHTQRLWRNFSDEERKIFMARLRHLWGVARHRIPVQIHDRIQQLRVENRLHITAGRILNIKEKEDCIVVDYFDKKDSAKKNLVVSRVINCTGPETDLRKLENSFLKKCLSKGLVTQDNLNLGIRADIETFQVMNGMGEKQPNLFTIGSNLKGELWESTAVNEIREQAQRLAARILHPSCQRVSVNFD